MTRTRFLPIAVAVCVVAIDQLSKALIVSWLDLWESWPVLHGILNLTRVENPGVAFGLFGGNPIIWGTTTVIALIAMLGVMLARSSRSPLVLWGVGLVGGGALGNLVDRLRTGKVIDFMELRIWPVFNLADVAIVLGVGFLLWALLRPRSG